ncbi:CRISPR-associated RAMP family protein, partial [Rhodospirillum rubrum]|nr:CRISPR-associated RAMP family protein [Rhodospirillum rubrum]
PSRRTIPGKPQKSITRPHPEDPDSKKKAKITAPFRFVGLAETVVQADGPTDIKVPLDGGVCATIDVEWAVESPLLIGEDDKGIVSPMKLSGDGPEARYIIPGATLRGLTRAAVEIVAHGRLGFVNAHHRYGVRDFEHRHYGADSGISNVANVKAGWLECTGDVEDPDASVWTLSPVENWSHIPIDTVLALIKNKGGDRFKWIGMSLEDKYSASGQKVTGGEFDFTRTVTLSPPRTQSIDVKGNTFSREICAAGQGLEGVLVFSDKVPFVSRPKNEAEDKMKKYEYVFHGAVGAPHPLHPSDVAAFQRLNSTPSDNKPTPTGTYKKLLPTLKARRRVPVFYVGELPASNDKDHPQRAPKEFFFGFTRLFKIPHTQSVGEVLKESRPNHWITEGQDHSPDFVEDLFGYVIEPKQLGYAAEERTDVKAVARRGRVAFSMAKINPRQTPKVTEKITTVMMAPRASFAPFYLAALGHPGELDYSAPEKSVTLAGRKRYLPRFTKGGSSTVSAVSARAEEQRSRLQANNADVVSTLRFLTPPAAGDDLLFTSRIRLTNVTPVELGAVLFALTHGGDPAKPYRHMIGRGKPFGAGQTRINAARLTVTANDTKAEALIQPPEGDDLVAENGLRGFCPAPQPNRPSHAHRPFLKAFETHMRQALKQPAFPAVPAIQEFLGASDPKITEQIGADRLDYMPLDSFNKVRYAFKRHKDGSSHPADIRPGNGKAMGTAPPKRLLPAPIPKKAP